jgi:LmbE family N-acetylglucosaminyl deacetylase
VKRKVIFLVAHPDDVACGAGGTAWLLKDHYKIHVLCLTKGERGRSPEIDLEVAAQREKEEQNSSKLLDAELTFLGQIDGEVFAERAICERVAKILTEEKPIAFFGMWPIDRHPDHSAASEIARKALELSKIETEFYMLEEYIAWQASQFDPDIFVDISEVLEHKVAQLRCHECHNKKDERLVRLFTEQARFRGFQANCAHAEGFKLIYPLKHTTRSILLDLKR